MIDSFISIITYPAIDIFLRLIYFLNYSTSCEIFISKLAGNILQEFEWQQVSIGLWDSRSILDLFSNAAVWVVQRFLWFLIPRPPFPSPWTPLQMYQQQLVLSLTSCSAAFWVIRLGIIIIITTTTTTFISTSTVVYSAVSLWTTIKDNERTTLLYKNISLILFPKRANGLLLVWEINGETDTQIGDFFVFHIFFREPGGSNACIPLQAVSSETTQPSARRRVPRSTPILCTL